MKDGAGFGYMEQPAEHHGFSLQLLLRRYYYKIEGKQLPLKLSTRHTAQMNESAG